MQITVARSIAIIAVAAVGVLGAQFASAATSHVSKAPTRNIAYLYAESSPGGTGQVNYQIANPPAGIYAGSFTASFYPAGTPGAPETFSCYLMKNGQMRAQSTVSTTYSSGFYAGVNGANTLKISAGDAIVVGCGTDDGTAWTWGTRPVQLTLTRLDGLSLRTLPLSAQKMPAEQGAFTH